MPACARCGHQELRRTTETLSAGFPASGVTASLTVAGQRCTRCRQTHVPPSVVREFDLAVACEFADRGIRTGEAVRHMRKVLRLRAADLARLLDLTPETISHWETGKVRIGRAAFVVLGALVQDALEGTSRTHDRLSALGGGRRGPGAPRRRLRWARTARAESPRSPVGAAPIRTR